MARGRAPRKSGRKKSALRGRRGGTRARRPNLPQLFQGHFDRDLRRPGDPRILCCGNIRLALEAPGGIGPFLENLALGLGGTPAQARAIGRWPEPQLRIFLGALEVGIRCPHLPPPPPPPFPPEPGPWPGPDPVPLRSFRMHFRGRRAGGARRIQIAMTGKREIEITFIAPRIP